MTAAVPDARKPAAGSSESDSAVCRMRPRIGAVSYLNSKPLVEGLAARLAGEVSLDYPSRLATALDAGLLDVALIPSIEVLRSAGEYEIVSDACVAARGPVRSVKVYFRVPPGDVKTLALDEGSRTSATLARVILHHRYGIAPETQPLPLGSAAHTTPADAILLIGDRAMFPVDGSFVAEWDLGAEWFGWTGLPFVFAVWAGRRDATPAGLSELLSSVRDDGVAAIDAIAAREAPRLGLEVPLVQEYLTHNLHFQLGSAERSGLKLFAQLAYSAGLAPERIELAYRTCDDEHTHDERHAPALPPADEPRPRRVVTAR